MSRFIALATMILIAAVAGCGSDNPWGPVAVSGKVTYEDGSVIPVESMTLYFAPQAEPLDEKTFPRKGTAGVNASDGSFDKATTYKPGDGLIPGKHKVTVVAYEGGRNLSPRIPKQYTSVSTTPLEVDTAESPFHIKIRTP
jgi:hypothetical protein